MQRRNGRFRATVELAAGEYAYKFLVHGKAGVDLVSQA
jgi:hypothetical protein